MSRRTRKRPGGFLFGVLNIGFTVFMFALPSLALGYWYFYIHVPKNARPTERLVGQPAQDSVQQPDLQSETRAIAPESSVATPMDSGSRDGQTRADQSVGFFGITNDRDPVGDDESKSTDGVRAQREVRRWTDASGGFSVDAKFLSADARTVKLQTEDNRKIEVVIDRLSEIDKAYLRSVFKSKGIRPSF